MLPQKRQDLRHLTRRERGNQVSALDFGLSVSTACDKNYIQFPAEALGDDPGHWYSAPGDSQNESILTSLLEQALQ